MRALGLDGARKACDALVDEAIGALSIFGARADMLREATRFVAARQS